MPESQQSVEIHAHARKSPDPKHSVTAKQLVVDLSKTGYRLPTDAEWEFIARGLTTTDRFIGTMETPLDASYAWCNTKTEPAEVYRRMPNRLGFFDVYGNVEEWTLTEEKHACSPVDLEIDRQFPKDEQLEDKTVFHVAFALRGGSFITRDKYINSYNKSPCAAGEKAKDTFGFRLARTH